MLDVGEQDKVGTLQCNHPQKVGVVGRDVVLKGCGAVKSVGLNKAGGRSGLAAGAEG
jgi:hypothetical protein